MERLTNHFLGIVGEVALEWEAQIFETSTLAFWVASRAASLIPSEELLLLMDLGAASFDPEVEGSIEDEGGAAAMVVLISVEADILALGWASLVEECREPVSLLVEDDPAPDWTEALEVLRGTAAEALGAAFDCVCGV